MANPPAHSSSPTGRCLTVRSAALSGPSSGSCRPTCSSWTSRPITWTWSPSTPLPVLNLVSCSTSSPPPYAATAPTPPPEPPSSHTLRSASFASPVPPLSPSYRSDPQLLEGIKQFQGGLLLISHDFRLIDQVGALTEERTREKELVGGGRGWGERGGQGDESERRRRGAGRKDS
eukprot:750370-Hanusia_phi.AAC.5